MKKTLTQRMMIRVKKMATRIKAKFVRKVKKATMPKRYSFARIVITAFVHLFIVSTAFIKELHLQARITNFFRMLYTMFNIGFVPTPVM